MKRNKGLRICILLLVLNVLFIWGNSLLPGTISGAISGFVRDVLAVFFPDGGENPENGHGLLRKAAHFTEFACLGGLFYWLFAMLKKPVWLAFFVGVAVAAVDETIQIFVPDRGPSIFDVAIDSSGVALGMILLLVGYAIKRRKKQAMEDVCI